jgi:ABC-type antimicrobial peptide transport system permease subunit
VTVNRVKTLDAQLSDSIAGERLQTVVLVSFGSAALALAMLGIYGVLSCSVAARKQEIGVRIALGATRQSIYAVTFGEACLSVAGGLTGGWRRAFSCSAWYAACSLEYRASNRQFSRR